MGDRKISEAAVRAQLRYYFKERRSSLAASGPPRYEGCVKAKRAAGAPDGENALRRACRAEYDLARVQELSALVHAEWLRRELHRRGFDPNRELQRGVDRAKRLFIRAAKAPRAVSAFLPDKHNLAFQTETMSSKLSALIPLTAREVESYGRQNSDLYYGSEVRVAQILQTTSKVKALKGLSELKHGSSWKRVQNRYGLRPIQQYWTGKERVYKSAAPHNAFGRTLFSVEPHKLVGPVQSLDGWFLMEVLDVRPPRHRNLSPETRRHIVTLLRGQKLGKILFDHYADKTRCAKVYKTANTPECS